MKTIPSSLEKHRSTSLKTLGYFFRKSRNLNQHERKRSIEVTRGVIFSVGLPVFNKFIELYTLVTYATSMEILEVIVSMHSKFPKRIGRVLGNMIFSELALTGIHSRERT